MGIITECPFWDRTRKLLKENKITQAELAVKLDIPYSTLRYWMCYGFMPDVELACEIADLLDVQVEYLVKGKKAGFAATQARITRIAVSAIKKMEKHLETGS